MSSHREAPGIALDPVADSTDLYAFVSPDDPSTVTLIANYVPLQLPPAGPNFYEFGDDVLYEIHVDNDGDGIADITFQFQFYTKLEDDKTFLYNTGQITSISDATWNRRQFYSVACIKGGSTKMLGRHLPCPPCNVGVRSIPNYAPLEAEAIHDLGGQVKVFAGQRAEGFYVDLGSIFDLGALRPFQELHLIPLPAAPGVNAPAILNVHSIAIQVPIASLTSTGTTPSASAKAATIGVWTTASRQKAFIRELGHRRTSTWAGPWTQVSRLGNPLVNEVVIPMARKDYWNTQSPRKDSQFVGSYANPELAGLLPVLYPGVFPNLAALDAAKTTRADLIAILLTGIPSGIVPGFQNYTGPVQADMLRLNVAIPPTSSPSLLGLLGGDAAGFPNGRRVFDDVVSIELRAVAGLSYALVDSKYTPDSAAGAIYDIENPATTTPAQLSMIGETYQSSFPYLTQPHGGFQTPSTTP
ncbi:MAG: DUF4331 domain-containing protein [Acidimicrobiales bacterium]|jgi:hypothetical protein